MMRTSNPALNDNTFSGAGAYASGETMTIQGTTNKTFVLLFLLICGAVWIWGQVSQPVINDDYPVQTAAVVGPWLFGGMIAGFILAMVTVFKKEWSPYTAPLYAICEGVVLGAISAFAEMSYPGIVSQAVMLTFGTLFCLLGAYKSGLIKPTENFKLGLFAATGAICLVYLVTMVLGFFHVQVPMIYGSGPIGIVFSLVVVTIAALNLVLDFDFIEQGASRGAPKYMEWYGAFGLMVTLIWLYLEILRLLMKMRDRR